MREIRFRGKRLDNGDWVFGYYYCFAGRHHIHAVEPWEGGASLYCAEVDPSTVGQFTGLRDKNGQEIYEGDVLRHETGFGHIVSGIIRFGDMPIAFENRSHVGFFIEWSNDGANMWNEWWRHDLKFWVESGVEVIGTIHDDGKEAYHER